MVNVLKPQKYVLTFLRKILKMGAVVWQNFGSIQSQNIKKQWKRRKTEYGSSDNWHDVSKAWPDPDRYEYTGREIKIVDNT